jgi:hypothetical protein
MDTYNAAKDANIPGAQLMTYKEWESLLESDPKFALTHTHLSAGFSAPTVGEDGITVKPGEGQIAVLRLTEGGEMALPASSLEQPRKLGPLSKPEPESHLALDSSR